MFGSEPVFHGDNNIYHHREAKREIGERDRSREREGESLKACGCERGEECSQRCSQGCWVGRGQ